MNDVENGFTSATNHSRPTNGTSSPAVTNAARAEAPRSPARPLLAATFSRPLDVLRALRDSLDPSARGRVEATVLGDIATRRSFAAKRLLPLLIEWHRLPRNTGAEALLLSVLSTLPSAAPDQIEAAIMFCAGMRVNDGVGPRVFADLSITGKVLVSMFDGGDLPRIFEKVAASTRETFDVGAVVRTSSKAVAASARTDELMMLWDRGVCEGLWAGGGAIVGGFAGMALGASIGPAGIIAGGIGGALSGAADGIQIGDKVCAGVAELAPADLGSTGPYNPPGPESAATNLSRLSGWTFVVDPFRPVPDGMVPWYPNIFPFSGVIPPYGPAIDPIPPIVGSPSRESASLGPIDSFVGALRGLSLSIERLSPMLTLIGGVREARAL